MTPVWIFPAYPILLVGPYAASLINAVLDADDRNINYLPIAFAAVTLQGAGFVLSLAIYAAFIYRLMTQKIPKGPLKPGMFVSVGPSGFTVAGIIQLGLRVGEYMPADWGGQQGAAFILKIMSIMIALWLWALCLWFFMVSVGAHWRFIFHRSSAESLRFAVNFYTYVFPNTSFTIGTIVLGEALGVKALEVVGTVMAVGLVVVWLWVTALMIRALLRKRLLWPEPDIKLRRESTKGEKSDV
jgi:tellurite resistance protein TehA-like permease